ncbi:MAG: tRNA pseudouridine(38-40) synthase TruA [Clostridia bacterium]|nr:tRNA pseudouridine(38-40) synthase TruA [Clostridia bacterium]
MRNLLCRMSYNGTAYHGFQRQKNAVTIEETVENALDLLTGEKNVIYGCGRTDARVHGINYYFNFKTDSSIPVEKFPLALNSKLPDDISVSMCREVPDDFNARFSAIKKTYRYLIYNDRIRNPFYDKRAMFFPRELDVEKMREAADKIKGTKDFAAFMAQGSPITDTVRSVYSIEIEKKDNIIQIDVCGNGFLYNMVRIIVGTIIDTATGKIKISELDERIASKKRENTGFTAVPDGLYLYDVYYDI